jgi:streptomycin 6-kinase
MLKMGVPHPELAEIQSLRAFNGNGAVRLIDADPHQGVLLVERIIPGDDLRTVDDDRAATRIAARLMKVLWMPDPHDPVFPSTAAWCQGFQRYQHTHMANGPLPFDLVQLAGRVAADLLQSAADPVLLHGDLHHMNILKSGDDAWVAIDPKGVIGEAAFEVGALLLNPVPDLIHWPDLQETQKERLIILEEELGIDRQRLAAWSFVRAVLSAIWSLEDGEDFEYGVAVAKIMKKLL